MHACKSLLAGGLFMVDSANAPVATKEAGKFRPQRSVLNFDCSFITNDR
jgi:hypothetical protein